MLVLLLAAAFGAMPASASGYTAADGYAISDYATGFPIDKVGNWGPIGVAFDDSDNLYVSDNADGHLYRFQPGGGAAGPDTRLTSSAIDGDIKGLAINRDGDMFLARGKAGDVVEVDPASGRVLRTAASGIPCALALAVDPISDDLFVSQGTCGPSVLRISNYKSGTGTVRPYSTTGCCVDGLAFGDDGTLYAADDDGAVRIDGTNTQTPGAPRSIASLPHGDGIAVGPAPAPGQQPFLVVNGTDGRITRIDFSKSPPAQSPVMTGGSRGDFVAVDSLGCLYATQTSSIVRVAPEGSACDLVASTPGASGSPVRPGLVLDVVNSTATEAGSPAKKCKRLRKITLRVRQRGGVRLRFVRVYVGSKRVKTLRNKKVSSKITLRSLPRRSFTVKLVAKTTKGKTLKKRKRFKSC